MTIVKFNPRALEGILYPTTLPELPTFVWVPDGVGTAIWPGFEPVVAEVVEGVARADLKPNGHTAGTLPWKLWAVFLPGRTIWPHDVVVPESGEYDVTDLVSLDPGELAQMEAAAEGVFELEYTGES